MKPPVPFGFRENPALREGGICHGEVSCSRCRSLGLGDVSIVAGGGRAGSWIPCDQDTDGQESTTVAGWTALLAHRKLPHACTGSGRRGPVGTSYGVVGEGLALQARSREWIISGRQNGCRGWTSPPGGRTGVSPSDQRTQWSPRQHNHRAHSSRERRDIRADGRALLPDSPGSDPCSGRSIRRGSKSLCSVAGLQLRLDGSPRVRDVCSGCNPAIFHSRHVLRGKRTNEKASAPENQLPSTLMRSDWQ